MRFSLLSLLLVVLLCSGCDLLAPGQPKEFTPTLPQYRELDTEPAWHPSGAWIAYTHKPQTEAELALGGLTQVWVLEMATGQRQFVTAGFSPSWSPDGRYLAVVRGGVIYRVEVETGEERRLTAWGESYFHDWSPDGQNIAFDTSYGDERGANVIWVMSSDGTQAKDISQHGVGEWRDPAWSHDGQFLAHLRYIGVGFPEIFVMDRDGGDARRLTWNQREDRSPVWSEDGSWIAWSSWGELSDETNGIWLMRPDGTGARQLTRREGALTVAFHPAFSPGGQRVAYTGYNAESATYTLWIVNTDGTGDHPLTLPEDYNP